MISISKCAWRPNLNTNLNTESFEKENRLYKQTNYIHKFLKVDSTNLSTGTKYTILISLKVKYYTNLNTTD